MSNFICPHCGMTNIDCGAGVYKTPRELELENIITDMPIFPEVNSYK